VIHSRKGNRQQFTIRPALSSRLPFEAVESKSELYSKRRGQTEGPSNRLSMQSSRKLLKCRILIAMATKLQQSTCAVLTGPFVCLVTTLFAMIELNIFYSLFLLLLFLLLVYLTLLLHPFAHEYCPIISQCTSFILQLVRKCKQNKFPEHFFSSSTNY
jgi:hypothetical protein